MILVLHIIFALLGILLTTLSLLAPSLKKIRMSYYLVGLTVVTGSYIIVTKHLSIKSVCLSGLLYIGFTVSCLIAASRKLAHQAQKP